MTRKIYYQLFTALFLGVVLFLTTSCEGPAGPAGINGTPGVDGKDGNDGLNGKDANTACLVCHTQANMDTIRNQYHLSKHFYGNTSARNTKYCAGCHTGEGMQEIVANGKFVVANDIPNGTRISCVTCHSHSAFDFTGDTATYILRTTSPVFLNYNKNLTATDFGKINNLCVTCHQIRGATSVSYLDSTKVPAVAKAFTQLPFFPLSNAKENTTVKYQVGQSFSVHDGNQSNLFAGINAYEYVGKTYTRTWKHSTYSCTDCHMNAYDATTKTGGHTLIANKAECAKCHTSDHIADKQALIKGKLIELGDLLVTRKVFAKIYSKTSAVPQTISYSAVASHDFYGVLLPNSATPGTTAYGIALASTNTVDPKTGLVIYANKVTFTPDFQSKAATSSASTVVGSADRIGREWKYGELGAAYNYMYINSELSLGVHNPVYALQVLQNSIDWLNTNP